MFKRVASSLLLLVFVCSIFIVPGNHIVANAAGNTYTVGQTAQLYCAASYGTNTFVSSNTGVVTVISSNGGNYFTIKAVSVGSAVITAYVHYMKLIYDPVTKLFINQPMIDRYVSYSITVTATVITPTPPPSTRSPAPFATLPPNATPTPNHGQAKPAAPKINVVTDKSKTIGGTAVAGGMVKLTAGSNTYSVGVSSNKMWSLTLAKKLSIGMKITAKVTKSGSTSAIKTTYVRPSKPSINQLTTKSKSIFGSTYPKAYVSININGVWNAVTANAKGAYTFKLSKTLTKDSLVKVKVTYHGQNSSENSMKVKLI